MSLIDYIIIIVPLTFVIGMGVYCKGISKAFPTISAADGWPDAM